MTVGDLIKILKKLPKDVEIGTQDHDSSEYTITGWPHDVVLLDFDEIPTDRRHEDLWDIEGLIAVIRT